MSSPPTGGPATASRGTREPTREMQRRALVIALVANGVFMVVEVVGGLVFGSLALLADAAHMLSDVAALSIALVAQHLATRPASDRHTFGLQRAEVLGAQANALVLLAAAGWVFFEAAQRLDTPHDVEGGGLLLVATLGLVVNVASAVLLARVRGRSLNISAALTHMVADAAGSVAAMAAGVAVLVGGVERFDPAVSILIGALVVWAAVRLLGEAAHVLMEGAPRDLDVGAVADAMLDVDGIVEVHDLHLWNLASDVPALSAHVLMEGEVTLHEGQRRAALVKSVLASRFGIEHATLEIECHECVEPEPVHGPPPASGAAPNG